MPVVKFCLGVGATIIAVGVMAPGALKVAREAVVVVAALAVVCLPLAVMESILRR